ncbi:MAG: DUF4124 domain-containing protein [Gammaproteobacteria bacterium]|nr:DUF4124 domain-containing protein [Gammaproteobacteria bacterium]MCP5459232.1 DUF4124 domain-containing protein [Gammaproteobacteria bacterium]
MRTIPIVLLMTGLGLTAVAQEGVYRWQDAEGQVHYGDAPPPNGAATPATLNPEPVRVKPPEQVYTWTDAEGGVHYGERPPADQAAKTVDMDSRSMSTIQGTQFRAGERALLRELEGDRQ